MGSGPSDLSDSDSDEPRKPEPRAHEPPRARAVTANDVLAQRLLAHVNVLLLEPSLRNHALHQLLLRIRQQVAAHYPHHAHESSSRVELHKRTEAVNALLSELSDHDERFRSLAREFDTLVRQVQVALLSALAHH